MTGLKSKLVFWTALTLSLLISFWWWSTKLPKTKSAAISESRETPLLNVYWLSGDVVAKTAMTGIVEPLREGESVGEGMSVRTFADSHVVFQVPGANDRIEVGPNSELAFAQQESDLKIFVLRGEVFCTFQGEKTHRSYLVNSSRMEVATANADFLVYVAEGGAHRLGVYRGQTALQVGGKSLVLKKDQYIGIGDGLPLAVRDFEMQVTTPLPNDRVYLENAQQEKTRFAWTKVPAGANVTLLVGRSPEDLKPVEVERNVSKPNEILFRFDEGVFYWRLKAVGKSFKKEVLSPVYKMFVLAERPVQLLDPAGKLGTATVKRLGGVLFRWSNPSRLERLFLEVSKDSSFSQPVLRQPLADSGRQLLPLEGEGHFFWRVNGFRHDSSELVTSSAFVFDLVESETEPQLEYPQDGEKITRRSLRRGEASVVWTKHGLTSYEVKIEPQAGTGGHAHTVQATTTESRYRLPELPVGRYHLTVGVLGAPKSRPAERDFEVIEARSLAWTLASSSAGVIPSISKLKWEPSANASVYRVRLWPLFPVQEAATPFSQLMSNRPELILDLPEDGLYVAVVQAVGREGGIQAETESLLFRPGSENHK